MEKIKSILEKISEKTKKEVLRIKTMETSPSIFSSKFGGGAYWPEGLDSLKNERGEELSLLVQINLEDLPGNHIFKPSGIIQIFIEKDDVYGMDFDDYTNQDGFRLIYHEEVDKNVVDRRVMDFRSGDLDYFPLEKEMKIEFQLDFEGISSSDYRFEPLFIEEYQREYGEKIDSIYDLDEEILEYIFSDYNGGMGHKIGGYPFFTQEDPRKYSQEYRVYNELLFQMDSEMNGTNGEIIWGDVGVCNFFIGKEALVEMDFTKILYNWDCY